MVWSGIHPYDRLTWLMEVAPALIAAPLLWATAGRFRFSTVAYGLIPVHGLLLRRFGLKPGGLLGVLCACVCGSISAIYEIIEWWAAVWLGEGADASLGAQGDPWDTQSDMLFAFLGATAGVTLLASWHDRSMRRLRDDVLRTERLS